MYYQQDEFISKTIRRNDNYRRFDRLSIQKALEPKSIQSLYSNALKRTFEVSVSTVGSEFYIAALDHASHIYLSRFLFVFYHGNKSKINLRNI